MHCHICDKMLTEAEIIYNAELRGYEPCTVCLSAAMDAAYSGGFRNDEEVECFLEDLTETPYETWGVLPPVCVGDGHVDA
jgi:hypothetical protein